MSTSSTWTENRSLTDVRSQDLSREDVVFHHDQHLYRTTGKHLSQGGMGTVYVMERRPAEGGGVEEVVGKVFHAQYLYQLRKDEITRRDHRATLDALGHISRIGHPNLLPVYASAAIADNHLLVTPRQADTLLEVVSRGGLSPRRRVRLLMQALEGMRALHEGRLIHRDFTLRNVLVDAAAEHAYLFDFDLAMSLDDVVGVSYGSHYKGRIFGSPGFSVPPEIVDQALMESAITPRLDIYAIGGALFGLFTDLSPHGRTDDMWGLLMRIAEGVVLGGVSHIDYPAEVPEGLRPIIERCLERDPGRRFGSVGLVLGELEQCLDGLDDYDSDDGEAFHHAQETLVSMPGETPWDHLRSLHGIKSERSITPAFIDVAASGLARYGYRIERSLGRLMGRPIFLAVPVPELVAAGQFPDANVYPKIVTAVNLSVAPDAQEQLDLWFGRYLPVLKSVRQGIFTTLHKIRYDEYTGHLFLFSEFVDDPRFGTDLEGQDPTLVEALGLGFLIVRQVGQLHEQGLAHNNVSPASLLFKGVRQTRYVLPSMAGLVQPSTAREAIEDDVRHLAGLVLSWIRPERIAAADPRVRARLDELRARLGGMAFGEQSAPPGIDELFALVANALSAVDHNFGVLREHRGDLQDYLLLRVSHLLYGRLWPEPG